MWAMQNWKQQKHGRRLVFPTLSAARTRSLDLEARGYIVAIAPIGLRKIGLWRW
jgi:hypothetical protein